METKDISTQPQECLIYQNPIMSIVCICSTWVIIDQKTQAMEPGSSFTNSD